MTTFLSHTDADGDVLVVSQAPRVGIAGEKGGALVRSTSSSAMTIGTLVTPEEAPAVALAILKAAGRGPSSQGDAVGHAAHLIESFLGREERRAAYEADVAKLDAEALALLNGLRESRGFPIRESLDELPDDASRDDWRAIAEAARRLAQEEAGE